MKHQGHPPWRLPLAYGLTAGLFLTMDAVWLTSTHARLYQPAIGHLMAPTIDWIAVAIFYAAYFAGLQYFAVMPALAAQRPALAMRHGALLGLLAYGTYDFTNQATMRGWPWHLSFIDLAWGGFATGMACWAAAAITAFTCRRWLRPSGR